MGHSSPKWSSFASRAAVLQEVIDSVEPRPQQTQETRLVGTGVQGTAERAPCAKRGSERSLAKGPENSKETGGEGISSQFSSAFF